MESISVDLLFTLVDRESYWLRQKVILFNKKKIVIFPAGPTAQAFYHTLLNDYGIEAEFFIDNNPDIEGKSVCGKPIKLRPWEQDATFKDRYAVLIPTVFDNYYFQIVEQLEKAGNMTHMHAFSYCACQLWDKYQKVLSLLCDNQSKLSYLGAIYSLLTFDNTFIRYETDGYFALKPFTYNGYETVVDAGAYTGDTVEKYVIHGSDSIKIYAFEPYDKAREKLEARVKRLKNEWILDDDDIVVVNAGVGDETKMLSFSSAKPTMLKPDEYGDTHIKVYSLDDYFRDKKPFTVLKADIEGGELDMLRGASTMIQKYKPKLAICIYHSPKDFVQIAEYIYEIVPEYNMAVRSHFYDYRETVLYCWL